MSVKVDSPAENVTRILINRPDKRNAIDAGMRAALRDALEQAQQDDNCRAIVFGGVDGMFSAGGDLPSMVGISEENARARMAEGAAIIRLVTNMPKPVVSAIEGFGAGAAVGLALAGDHIVVGKETKILFPFLNLGLVPDWGQVRTLSARIGAAKAKQLFLNGKPLTGEQAFELGVADEIAEDIMAAAIHKSARFAALPQVAFAQLKQRLNHPSQSWDEEFQREEDDQQMLLRAEDFTEGFAAFSEKRKPQFKDLKSTVVEDAAAKSKKVKQS